MCAYTQESKLQLLYQHKDGAGLSVCWDDSKCTSDEVLIVNHSAKNTIAQRPDCESFEVSDEDSDVNDGPPLILECGGACSCSADCCLRVTQQGLSVRVIVVRQRFTGWGLHAAQHISKGSFICEYAGMCEDCIIIRKDFHHSAVFRIIANRNNFRMALCR